MKMTTRLRSGALAPGFCVATLAFALGFPRDTMAMQRLQASTTGNGGREDQMGASVALSGDSAVVSAPWTQLEYAVPAGQVDLYRLVDGAWQPDGTLTPEQPDQWQTFGMPVALDDGVLVFGAIGPGGFSTLHTYERGDDGWRQVDVFGGIVSTTQIGLSGDTLATGGQIFVRSGSGWQLQTTLVSDDGAPFVSMAVDGDLLVAATNPDHLDAGQAAYFYSRRGSTWTRENWVEFGEGLFSPPRVAISGNTVLVSELDLPPAQTSSVHAYERDDTGIWIDRGVLDTGGPMYGSAPVSIEGNTALVGATEAAYLFTRANGIWTRAQALSDPTIFCDFASVAIEGATALVGCPGTQTDAGGFGTADFFDIGATPPAVVARFGQGDSHMGEHFGTSVAASGSTLAAASYDGVYFFDSESAGFTQTTFFPTPSGTLGAYSVAIDGNVAAAAYPFQNQPGYTSELDLYERSGGAWSLQSTFPEAPEFNIFLGISMALAGDALIVGEADSNTITGTCLSYARIDGTWTREADILPIGGTASSDRFCYSLALSGDTLFVGAPGATIGSVPVTGVVYVFTREGTTWTQTGTISPPIPTEGGGFGISVAMHGDTAVVGAIQDYPLHSTYGEADVFHRTGGQWAWQATLGPPPDGDEPYNFGYAVAISDSEDHIVATDPSEWGSDPLAGVAYTFAFDGNAWALEATLQGNPPFPRTMQDNFGWSATWTGENVVIGAPADGNGGAVYVGATSPTIFADGFDAAP